MRGLPGAARERLRSRASLLGVDLRFDEDESGASWTSAEAIVVGDEALDAAALERATRCLAVVRAGAGAGDIDANAARHLGIVAADVRDFASEPAAAAIVDFAMRDRRTRVRNPDARGARPLRWGFLGFGSVARAIVGRIRELASEEGGAGAGDAIEFFACDPFAAPEDFGRFGVRRCPEEDLPGVADVLSIHVPATPATRGWIDPVRIARAPRGALWIAASSVDRVSAGATALPGELRPRIAIGDWRRKPAPDDDVLGAAEEGTNSTDAIPLDFSATEPWRERAVGEAIRIASGEIRGIQPDRLLNDPACPRRLARAAVTRLGT